MIVRISAQGCPVCGHPAIDVLDNFKCATFEICPCCGVESGYEFGTEVTLKHLEKLRYRWFVEQGGQWWSTAIPAPADWNARIQMEKLGLDFSAKS